MNKHFWSIDAIHDFIVMQGYDFTKKYVEKNYSSITSSELREGDVAFAPDENSFFKIFSFVNRELKAIRSRVDHINLQCEISKNVPWYIFAPPVKYFLVHRPGADTMINNSRKDFCQTCNNDNLYWQAMAAKCAKCHRVILGG